MVFTWCKAIFSDCYIWTHAHKGNLNNFLLGVTGAVPCKYSIATHSRSQNLMSVSASFYLAYAMQTMEGALFAYRFSDNTSSKCNLYIVEKTLKWTWGKAFSRVLKPPPKEASFQLLKQIEWFEGKILQFFCAHACNFETFQLGFHELLIFAMPYRAIIATRP